MAPKAILVVDSAGFTRFTSERGEEAALEHLEAFRERGKAFIEAFAGELLKAEADNLFAVFPDVRLAAAAGLAITSDRQSSAGVGFGRLIRDGSDWIGDELNLASHLGEDDARHGEVRLTEAAKAQLHN